jgi:hypothetical protein
MSPRRSDVRLEAVLREVEVLKQRLAEVERQRQFRARWLVASVLVVASVAFGQLTVFNADSPAVASQVNGNFNQLRTWLEQKVGAAGSANVSVTGTLNVTGTTTLAATNITGNTVVAGSLRSDFGDTTHDVWIQGGAGTSGNSRNLALLGTDDDSGDTLFVNHAGEYTGGTRIESNVIVTGRVQPNYDSGWTAVASNNNYTFTHNFGATPSHIELLACGAITGGALGSCITRVISATSGFNDGNSCINPINTTSDNNTIYVALSSCNAWGFWTSGIGFQYTGDADGVLTTAFYRVLAWR